MTDGAHPLWLHQAQAMWLVSAGKVDLFAIPVRDGLPAGTARHLWRVEAGQAIFALEWPAEAGIALQARGVADSRLQPLAADDFTTPEAVTTLAAWLDEWIVNLSAALVDQPPPRQCETLTPGQTFELTNGQIIGPESGAVWVRHWQGGSSLMGVEGITVSGATPFPLSEWSWLAVNGEARVSTLDSATCLGDGLAWAGLAAFHGAVVQWLGRQMSDRAAAEWERLHRVALADQEAVQRAITRLGTVLRPEAAEPLLPDDASDPLLAACGLVCQALGVELKAPPAGQRGRDPLDSIARASRVRTRRVALRGPWWRGDNGPLLAFGEGDHRPLAVLPDAKGRYMAYDPGAGNRSPVTPEFAATLEPFAYSFFRTFPDRAITPWEVLRFGLRGSGRDLLTLLLTGLGLGFLSLAPAIVTGVVIDSIIPAVNQFKLLQLTLALVVAALATGLFLFVRSLAVLRLDTRMGTAIQAAVWDRVLNLPAAFFRGYSAGDLAARVNGLGTVRQIVSGITISSILSGIFSLVNLALLFYYDPGLALVAALLVLTAIGVAAAAGYWQLRAERPLNRLQTEIAGTVLQLVGGIAKLRVAGAEARAIAVWANKFAAQRRLTFRVRTLANLLAVFNAAFPSAALVILFATIASSPAGETPSTGRLLAFVAAFSGMLVGGLSLGSSALYLLRAIPLFENVKPLLETSPEIDTGKADPGPLNGAIEVSHVSFRYQPDGPLVLDDVSLQARPGEFIAVVGPSGSGKSTLFRLLLGFERPESGSIYYGGHDLAELNVQAVRRQIGVVLQNGQLMPGDIFSNIIGSSLLTIDDAWEAARLAGLDEDIRQMPMGMYTVISEAASTFSGGQRQRLLIARALVNRPRVLLFDEATSALDNQTQAVVSRSLEQLRATRVVIAHRLSTIAQADRIYVIEGGKVVQQGSYAALANQEGVFQNLIRRQLVK